MLAFSAVTEATANDRMYDCLPLYHTSGGVLAIGSVLMVGGSVYIREKFSARKFWADVTEHDCTLFQYIGELCRYLVDRPARSEGDAGTVSGSAAATVCGPTSGRPFASASASREIREFYAATEGNAVLFNFDNTPGAVGRIPRWARPLFPITNIRFDLERETPVRGDDGLCLECGPDEIGEMVSQIVINPLKPGQRFEGYADKVETEKKILRDVLRPGDMWFRSGDLVRRDARGYCLLRRPHRRHLPLEGRERLDLRGRRDPDRLSRRCWRRTSTAWRSPAPRGGPAWSPSSPARTSTSTASAPTCTSASPPTPARSSSASSSRSTARRPSSSGRSISSRDGFDPTRTDDPIFLDDPGAGRFVRLDKALFARLQSGAIRL